MRTAAMRWIQNCEPTLTRLSNKTIFGRQRPQTPYRACVRGRRHQNFQKSSVWRPARPKRSGNVTISHVPRKQKESGGSWCQNSSLKFWPPGTELWPARVQKKQNKCIQSAHQAPPGLWNGHGLSPNTSLDDTET